MKRTLFTLALMLQVGLAGAEWYDEDGYDAAGSTGSGFTSTGNDGDWLEFDEAPGVDPFFSTPTASTSSDPDHPGVAPKQKGFVPSDIYFEYFGNMSITSQHSHLHLYNVYFNLPLTTSEYTNWRNWHFDMNASLRATKLETAGENVLDESMLYTLGLQANLCCKIDPKLQFQMGFAPQFSSDFDVMSSRDFYWGGYMGISARPTDRLSYTVGLAYVPQYYSTYVMPMLNLTWRFVPNWELRVQAARMSVENVARNDFQWGPFFQWNSSCWTVHRERETEQFRMTNCILGVESSYKLQGTSGADIMLKGDLGCSFYNSFRVRDKSGDHTYERYRAHPALYVRAGVQVTF